MPFAEMRTRVLVGRMIFEGAALVAGWAALRAIGNVVGVTFRKKKRAFDYGGMVADTLAGLQVGIVGGK